MARGAAAPVLVMTTTILSLAALLLLVAAGIVSAAAASGDTDNTIRLPTDVTGGGVDELVTAMASATRGGDGEERPWECCDRAVCTRSMPPICRCLDRVDRCSSACRSCEDVRDQDGGGDSRHRRCADWYTGDPGPMCHEDDWNSRGLAAAAAAAAERRRKATASAATGGDEERRPWKCCSLAVCTRSQPPVCRCLDEVERCAGACERCEKVRGSSPRRYRCLDSHRGDPGPRCGGEEWAPTVATQYGY